MSGTIWVDRKGIAEHFGVSINTIISWVKEKGMPEHRADEKGDPRYDVEECDFWLKGRKEG